MTYCSYCGNKLTNNANFCNSCGSEVNGYSYHNNPSTPHPKFQQRTSAPNTYAILGWIFNGLSIFFIPIIFAAAGVFFGYLHRKNNDSQGTLIMISGVGCGIFGMLLGMAMYGY